MKSLCFWSQWTLRGHAITVKAIRVAAWLMHCYLNLLFWCWQVWRQESIVPAGSCPRLRQAEHVSKLYFCFTFFLRWLRPALPLDCPDCPLFPPSISCICITLPPCATVSVISATLISEIGQGNVLLWTGCVDPGWKDEGPCWTCLCGLK